MGFTDGSNEEDKRVLVILFFFLQSSPSTVHCFSFHLNDYDRCNGILKYYFIVKTILIV